MSAWSDYKMGNWTEDDYDDGYDDDSNELSLDDIASRHDQDDADDLHFGIEPMGACSCCGGSGTVVVDVRYVPSTWTDPGYDEEILEQCDECRGSGCMRLGAGGEVDSTLDDDLFEPGYALALERQFNQERA